MKKLAILFTLMLSIMVNAHADYQQAAILYIGKNYDEAYNMLVPLAENSNDAQFSISARHDVSQRTGHRTGL